MDSADELALSEGRVAAELRAEFPALRLRTVALEAAPRRSPPELRARLRAHSDRVRGAQAVALRGQPIPAAHRVFFHHVGIDPDVQRVPAEAAIVERLVRGGFDSHGLPDDALLLGLLETGVAVWALDAATVAGELELRTEPGGQLVVADERGVVAPLFGPVAPDHAVTRRTRAMRLYAVQVPGVADLFVEEALWTCVEALV
jgi:DNA/RNA-binding domain of Phe-tRNA-synthetase-like protein